MQISKPLMTHALVGLAVAGAVAFAANTPSNAPSSAALPYVQPEDEMDPEAMMADWIKLNAPGEKHEWFEQFLGEWDTETKMTMPGMEAEPASHGTAVYTPMFDGRFLVVDSRGEMMGQSVQGYGVTGYDNHRNMYNTLWIDSMSTRWYTARGRVSQDGKMLEVYGSMDEPSMNEIGKPVRYRTRIINKDKHIFEAWEVGGLEMKVFEITYTRVK